MSETHHVDRTSSVLYDEPVEYDETKTLVSTELQTTAPSIISGSAGITVTNVPSGFKFNSSVSINGVPGTALFGVVPKIGIGGLSAGALVNTDPGNNISIMPQFGIGGIDYLPGSGICSGLWCLGAGPVTHGMLLIVSGIEVIRSFFEVESENYEDLPLVITSKIARKVIPIEQILGMWSFVRGRTGIGPEVKQFRTIIDFETFRRGIRILLGINSRPEAIARIKEAIGVQDNPFVKAELMDLLDRAFYEQNHKDFPTSSIEENIRRAVGEIESFSARYGNWLKGPVTQWPPDTKKGAFAGVANFMANALYLAKKLNMTVEKTKDKNGKTIMKIRSSAPFQIRDPLLATRFIEAVAGIYRALENKDSGLSEFVRISHGNSVQRVIDEAGLLKTGNNSASPGQNVLEAETSRISILEWIGQMEQLYGGFHQRRAHMLWVARRARDVNLKKSYTDRISKTAIPYPENLAKNFAEMRGCPEELVLSHVEIKPAVDTLLAAAKLEQEVFPGHHGNDISLLWDEERVRTWAYHAEIVDSFYLYGTLVRRGTNKPLTGNALKLARASVLRLIGTMRRNIPEVRREWYEYVARPSQNLKSKMLKQIRNAWNEIHGINADDLKRLITRVVHAQNDLDYLNGMAKDMSANLASVRSSLARIKQDARDFRINRDGLNSFSDLFAVEDYELSQIGDLLGKWSRLKMSFGLLVRALKRWVPKNGESNELLDEWKTRMIKLDSYMAKIVKNHARFNMKRTGAVFMESFLKEAGIDPSAPREITALDVLNGRGHNRMHPFH